MFKKVLVLGLFLLTGCNSLPVQLVQEAIESTPIKKDRIPDEVKEFAQKSLKYGDYYMKEFTDNAKMTGEEPDYQILKIGYDLIKQEKESLYSLSMKLFPTLDPDTVLLSKRCYLTLREYSEAYLLLTIHKLAPILTPDDKADLDTKWGYVIKSRGDLINDCQL